MGINLNLDPTTTQKENEEGRPPFQAGDRLSRFEFEKRYQAYPEIKKAELIEGVVYMPSPVRLSQHGNPHFNLIGWLNLYLMETPGLVGADNATVRLDFENEVQPDALIYLEPELGGQAYVGEDGYLEGAPEFIAEIAASTVAYDLHDKWRVYARSGVKEYLAFQVYEKQIDWFILREGRYQTIQPDEDGVLKSEIFPGLWLNGAAFWERDMAALKMTVEQGLESAEHETFIEQLKQ
jgi:Uma2 family endonuclease